MKSKFILITFGLLLISLFLTYNYLFEFGDTESGDVVKIYYVDNISEAHQYLIDIFNKNHTGEIQVIPIDIPFYKFSTNERKELLIRALRSQSERIDVFAADIIWVKRFSKWAEPLDDLIEPQIKNNFREDAKLTCVVDGKLVALPLYLDVGVLFYREDLLSNMNDYPKLKKKLDNSITWKEFIGLNKKMKFDDRFYVFPADEYEGLICSFTELILQKDESFFEKDFKFSNKTSLNAARLLADLTQRYKISPVKIINFREKDAYAEFLKNDCLFLRGWQSFSKDSKNLDKSIIKNKKIRMTQLPHLENGAVKNTIGGWNLMLTKNSAHKKESLEFMKFMLSDKAQKILFEKGAYLPSTKTPYKDSSFTARFPEIAFNERLLNEAAMRPQLENYTLISDILSHYLRLAIAGEISAEEAMVKADEEISKTKMRYH